MLKKSFLILILTTLMLMILFLIPCSANSTHTLAEFKFLKQGIPMELVYSTVGEPDEKSHCYVKYTIENSLVLEIYIDNNDSLSYATLLSDDGVRMYLLFNWGNGPIGSRNPINEATNTLQEKNVRMLSDLTYIRRGMKIDTITTRSGEPDAFAGSGLRWSVYKLNHNNLLHIHNFTSERVVLISLQTETAAAYIIYKGHIFRKIISITRK